MCKAKIKALKERIRTMEKYCIDNHDCELMKEDLIETKYLLREFEMLEKLNNDRNVELEKSGYKKMK